LYPLFSEFLQNNYEKKRKMKAIVDKLPMDQIIAELSKDKLLRRTNNGNNEVYLFEGNTLPR
jgi:hypothetical protein